MKRYRWGIIGTGHIAGQFAEGLRILQQAQLYAVASRSKEKAADFAKQYTFEKSYGSYQELFNDPLVDIVYIATPNHLHSALTLEALAAKKAVVCEKPLGLSPAEVLQMNQASEANHCFLMEAMWTAFLPSMKILRERIQQNEIGEPLLLKAEFGIHPKYDPQSRLFNPSMGGGSVYDIGIYPLFLFHYLLGTPVNVSSEISLAPTGVDMTAVMTLRSQSGCIASLLSSFACDLKSDAVIVGEKGSLRLDRMFHMPTRLYRQLRGEQTETEIPIEYIGNGYNYEAEEAMRCLDEGRIESEIYSHAFSYQLSDTISKVVAKYNTIQK